MTNADPRRERFVKGDYDIVPEESAQEFAARISACRTQADDGEMPPRLALTQYTTSFGIQTSKHTTPATKRPPSVPATGFTEPHAYFARSSQPQSRKQALLRPGLEMATAQRRRHPEFGETESSSAMTPGDVMLLNKTQYARVYQVTDDIIVSGNPFRRSSARALLETQAPSVRRIERIRWDGSSIETTALTDELT